MLTVKFEKLFESKRIMHYRAAEYMGRAEKLNSYIQTPATGAPTKNKLRIISRSPPSSRIPLVLPQITSTKRFEDYIVQAENICGANNPKIFTKAEEAYRKLLSALNMLNLNISDGDNPLIPAIVRLCKASEAEGIVRLYNNFEIPILYFINMGDGDYRAAIPRVTGSIGLDCGRYMNKAHGVNEPEGYVVAEPGATYAGVDQYLVNKKLDQNFELNRSEHMVVLALGNIAESNMFTLYCGREIILLNGDLLKMGLIQLPGIRPTVDGVPQVEQPETKTIGRVAHNLKSKLPLTNIRPSIPAGAYLMANYFLKRFGNIREIGHLRKIPFDIYEEFIIEITFEIS